MITVLFMFNCENNIPNYVISNHFKDYNDLSNERVTLKSQLRSQSLYLSQLGAVLASALWRVSSLRSVVDTVRHVHYYS